MIPYFGTPIGGKVAERTSFLMGRHALVPFPRPEDLPNVMELCASFIVDNGAFSAWRKGEPVKDWKPYYEWVRSFCRHPRFSWAIIPDVIDGSEEENDMEISKWASWKGWSRPGDIHHIIQRSAPVWHLHESTDRLLRLARGWHLVCFGSSGEYADVGRPRWNDRMHEAFAAITDDQGYPRCKVHGLRMMDPAIFSRFPFTSSDSTNVAQNAAREAERHNCSVKLAREIMAERVEKWQDKTRHNSAQRYAGRETQRSLVYVD